MRLRLGLAVVTATMLALVGGGALAGCGAPAAAPMAAAAGPASPGPSASAASVAAPSPARRAPRGAPVKPNPMVNVKFDGTYQWAYFDRTTGARYESADANELTYSESLIKAWLAADYLAMMDTSGETPDLDLLSVMIRDSDDDAAETVWEDDGDDASILRMISKCGLVDSQLYEGWWSMTLISARDAVRLGECIATGTAAGPNWTAWLLNEMRQVRGEGRFGIIDALPGPLQAQVSIKNGWTLHYDDEEWRVNCLAVTDQWVMAVTTIYSDQYELDHGAGLCRDVAAQILASTAAS
jgi:hypothetical protein